MKPFPLLLVLYMALGSSAQAQGANAADSTARLPVVVEPGIPAGQVSLRVDKIPSPEAWGGDVQCASDGCHLVLVEHVTGFLVVYRLGDGAAKEVDRHPLAWHPDSAKWVSSHVIAAAVEGSAAIEFYRLDNNKLSKINSQSLGFQPREVTVLDRSDHLVALLATPYSGGEIRYIEYNPVANKIVHTASGELCTAPWYPTVVKRKAAKQYLIAVGCLDDRKVVEAELTVGPAAMKVDVTRTLKLNEVPRQVAYDAGGDDLYIAEELGGALPVYSRDTQSMKRHPLGVDGVHAVALGPSGYLALGLIDDVMILKKSTDGGYIKVAKTRTSGLPERIHWLPSKNPKQLQLVVLNSSGSAVDQITLDIE